MKLRVPVRCSCNVLLVLGTLPIEAADYVDGTRLTFELKNVDIQGLQYPIDIPLELKLQGVKHGTRREVVINSNNVPKQLLELLPGYEKVGRLVIVGGYPVKEEHHDTKPG